MDAVAGLLDGPRARQAFVLRSTMEPPWALEVQDEAPLTVVTVTAGDAWLRHGTAAPVRLARGDLLLLRGPDHYVIADGPETPVTAIIDADQECTTVRGEPLADVWRLGVRTWGNSPTGATVMLTGTYHLRGEVPGRLLRALPPFLVVRRDDADAALLELLHREVARDVPGQEAVLDRLLDLLVITALRRWLAGPEADAPEWYRAQADPVVGRALSLMHHNPAHPWTLAMLAREVSVSRAALARRFTELVGEPPMTFLTGWRITLAADLLLEPDETIASVAERVGYGSAFALSTAFKRVRGVSPQQHRRAAA